VQVDTPPDDIEAIRRLAAAVKARRLELRLSLRKAADIAQVARNTWTSLEEGTRRTSETSYAAIEAVLHWAPGSIEQIKSGEQPTPLTAFPRAQATASRAEAPGESDEALIRVMRSDKLSDEQKARIVRQLIAEQERARQHIIQMADELIAENGQG
jgi:hypothetical protein